MNWEYHLDLDDQRTFAEVLLCIWDGKGSSITTYTTYAAKIALGSPNELPDAMVTKVRASVDELFPSCKWTSENKFSESGPLSRLIDTRPLFVFEALFDVEDYPTFDADDLHITITQRSLKEEFEFRRQQGTIPDTFLLGVKAYKAVREKADKSQGGSSGCATVIIAAALVLVLFCCLS